MYCDIAQKNLTIKPFRQANEGIYAEPAASAMSSVSRNVSSVPLEYRPVPGTWRSAHEVKRLVAGRVSIAFPVGSKQAGLLKLSPKCIIPSCPEPEFNTRCAAPTPFHICTGVCPPVLGCISWALEPRAELYTCCCSPWPPELFCSLAAGTGKDAHSSQFRGVSAPCLPPCHRPTALSHALKLLS